MTVCVTEDPPQFVKFTTGHERLSPSDDEATVLETEQAIFDACEEIVAKRVAKLTRLVRAAASQGKVGTGTRSSRRS